MPLRLPMVWASAAEQQPKLFPSFAKIINGRTVVRIVGKPYNYKVHYYADKEGRLRRGFCTGSKCEYCFNDSLPPTARRASVRYSMWVIRNRELAILEVGRRLFQTLSKVVRETIEPTENYDIGILKTGEGIEATFDVDSCPIFKFDDKFWQEIKEKINKFSMKGLVGDMQAREAMELELREEERVLNKSW